jgi:hypothetical protein
MAERRRLGETAEAVQAAACPMPNSLKTGVNSEAQPSLPSKEPATDKIKVSAGNGKLIWQRK